ncbi:hemolysin family protein [uncultured Thiohalocapsa sp.]|uniref:hemolysin family protein n=1 Tax=uncultured Thiohalocapsa sp. TaxID=768990 RepID=UPI0026009B52|nr:hemolysin family protein [uncultured Thiohalocapsa sp.]
MEALLILMLILTNGVLAMSEIAVVSARQSRLEERAERGRRGAREAIALKRDPGAFLSTIQVGITLVGILMGALGEAALAQPLREMLSGVPLLAPSADLLALVLVVGAITYLSVVIGELVPKQLALLAPEALASLVARPLSWLSRAALPVVWLLSASSGWLLRLTGAHRHGEPPVSDEEIRVLMAQGAEAGVFHAGEEPMVANVLRLDELPIGAIMTPRNEIEALDLETEQEPEALKLSLAALRHTLVPVHRGGLDQHLLGVLRLADLLPDALATMAPSAVDLQRLVQPPVFVPQSLNAAQLLETFRDTHINLALIVDEYGSLEGLVTLADVLTAIVGTPLGDDAPIADEITRRADGSWLVDGSLPLERLRAELGLDAPLPGEEGAGFHTLGGFVMHMLGRVPQASEHFESAGLRFEVVDMDQQRVDKVLVERLDAR